SGNHLERLDAHQRPKAGAQIVKPLEQAEVREERGGPATSEGEAICCGKGPTRRYVAHVLSPTKPACANLPGGVATRIPIFAVIRAQYRNRRARRASTRSNELSAPFAGVVR